MNLNRALFGLCLTSLLACGGGSTEPSVPALGRVDVRDDFFSPAAVDADQQKSVTWTWRGATGHNVTFEDGAPASPTQVSGSHVRVFESAGTYRYRCTVHSTSFTSGMVGSVTVN
jgi:plastocyanin